jgi:beta-galactosidase
MDMKKYFYFFVGIIFFSCSHQEEARNRIDFTEDWKFYLGDDSSAGNAVYDDSQWRKLNPNSAIF